MLISFSSTAEAGTVIGGSIVGGSMNVAEEGDFVAFPGDLNLPASRMPGWYAATAAEATYAASRSTWPLYDATCECADDSCVADSGGVGCTPVSGTIPFLNSWGCAPADPADDSGEDWQQISCVLEETPDSSVTYLKAGTYDMGNAVGEIITIEDDNKVLRCEAPNTTTLQMLAIGGGNGNGEANCQDGDSNFDPDDICGASILSAGQPYEPGSVRPWTAGFTIGSTVITVDSPATGSIVEGGWIMLEVPDVIPDCPSLLDSSAELPSAWNTAHALTHFDKVVTIVGNTVTLERGIRYDLTEDAGCADSAVARPYDPLVGVGVDSCHFTSDSSIDPDDIGSANAMAFGGTAESFIVSNHFSRWEERYLMMTMASRNWFHGNVYENFSRYTENHSTSGLSNLRGAVDNVLENNYCHDAQTCVQFTIGAEGNVFGYNFIDHGTPPNGGTFQGAERIFMAERSVFNGHGNRARGNLVEGNDANGNMMNGDCFWGENGPLATAYRNRSWPRVSGDLVTDTWQVGVIGVERDGSSKCASGSHAENANFVGNSAPYFFTQPNCAAWPDCMGATRAVENNAPDIWLEKNVARSTFTCSNDPKRCIGGSTPGALCSDVGDCPGGSSCDQQPNRCGFKVMVPTSSMSCGTSTGFGSCEDGSGEFDLLGDNFAGEDAPASWSTDSVPSSLYHTSKPDWWCDEACDFNDAHSGIGAWGDDICTDLYGLPIGSTQNQLQCAHVNAERNTSTPYQQCDDEDDCGTPVDSVCVPLSDGLCDSDGVTSTRTGVCKLPAEIVLVDDTTCTCSGDYTRLDGDPWCS